jgi:DNA-binding CsgD family transcriptional regulator
MPSNSARLRNAGEGERWRQIVAIGAIVGDVTPVTIARYAEVPAVEAADAVARAESEGLIVDGAIELVAAATLVADLPADLVAEIHAAVARNCMAQGPSHLDEAVRHARAAGTLLPLDELVDLAEHAGRTSLSISDYASARRLFELAEELGRRDSPTRRARRLCDLAVSLDALGMVSAARDALAQAFDLAEHAGDERLAAHAAVQYAFPADWYAGDQRAGSLLQRADALELSERERVAVTAARAVVEMRIPVPPFLEHQLAWVTRASVAQPLAEKALEQTTGTDDDVRLLSLLAWRTTHRAPAFLAQRREVSSEALDIAQRLRIPGFQADAAIMLSVDAIESADRPRFDEALSVARWVAERDGNPRLGWHSRTVATGAAYMDDDIDAAREHRFAARAHGESVDSPGWFGAELVFMMQEALATDDETTWDLLHVPEESPVLSNPLGRAMYGLVLTRFGKPEAAEFHVWRALRQIDEEASYLLLATRCADVAVQLDAPDLVDQLVATLEPWQLHVAVDSNAWWCDGPVALWLAALEAARGNHDQAITHLDTGEQIANAIGDRRSLRRHAGLRASLAGSSADRPSLLTERELDVLRLIAEGATNIEIAARLCFSTSTIRNDTTSIYRKLAVKGRPEAAARAIAMGIVR